MFIAGHIYRRRELHETYGGQQQGGISTPARHPLLLIFSNDAGEQYGYRDGWQHSGLFYYTGEGQRGDMRMVSGNKAIAEHSEDGKDLHLFGQSDRRSYVKYVGQFVCVGSHTVRSQDLNGIDRDALVFELMPIGQFQDDEENPATLPSQHDADLTELHRLALLNSAEGRAAVARLTLSRYRSVDVRRYVMRRAGGVCEGCLSPAPFRTAAGDPYLEAHHIRRLSDGGPDKPEWVAAVCANCHRRAHYAEDASDFNRELARRLRR